MKYEFVANFLNVDVDGFGRTTHYAIKAGYNRIHDDGFADMCFETVAEFRLTPYEINERGGLAKFNEWLREEYAPLKK